MGVGPGDDHETRPRNCLKSPVVRSDACVAATYRADGRRTRASTGERTPMSERRQPCPSGNEAESRCSGRAAPFTDPDGC